MKRLTAIVVGFIAFACSSNDDDDGRTKADGGTGGSTPAWLGAPCEECDLATQVPRLAGAGSEDCGEIPVDANGADAVVCAHAAFDEKRAFHVIVELQGIDSNVRTLWLFDAGKLNVVSYDSNVCGGGSACATQRCGPRIGSMTCVAPVESSAPGVLFECEDQADPRTICGPPP